MAGREHGRAVEREAHDIAAVPRQGPTALAALHVPLFDGLVLTPGEEGRAVEREAHDIAAVPRQGPALAALHVPLFDGLVLTPGQEGREAVDSIVVTSERPPAPQPGGFGEIGAHEHAKQCCELLSTVLCLLELRHPQRRPRDLFFAEPEVHKDDGLEAVHLPRRLAHASERLRTERLLHLFIECGQLLKLGRLVAHVRERNVFFCLLWRRVHPFLLEFRNGRGRMDALSHPAGPVRSRSRPLRCAPLHRQPGLELRPKLGQVGRCP